MGGKFSAVDDCSYDTQMKVLFDETSSLDDIEGTGLSKQEVTTMVQCKTGPNGCDRDSTCEEYLDVYVKKNNVFEVNSVLNTGNQTFLNIEENVLNSGGACIEEPEGNNKDRYAADALVGPTVRSIGPNDEFCQCPP